MATNNFQRLEGRWQELYLFATHAEEYAHDDPVSSVIKLRSFSESLVSWLYKKLQLPTEPNYSLYEKVNADVFVEIVDESIRQKLNAIRLLGNKAAHAKRNNVIKSNEALILIKEAYLLGQWLYKTYTDNSGVDYPEYSDPEVAVDQVNLLNQSNQKLSKQLDDAKNELEKLEEDGKLSQHKINDLNQSLDKIKLEKFRNASSKAVSSLELNSENIKDIISIDDAFFQYNLNEGQQELITRLNSFLLGKDENIFILRGYAGTGKTFITKGLTEYFKAIGRNYLLAAPTGKASKVIANKTRSQAHTIHKSIYSSTKFKERLDDNLDGTQTYKYYLEISVNELSVDTVYIIDEASMVSDQYNEAEFVQFGSGYLLRDLLKFINLDHNDHRKKVIFIGDNAQLAPVRMNSSPALDMNYLSKKYSVKSTSYELTEVVRQKADSGVMQNSIKLRESLQKQVFNKLEIDFEFPDLMKINYPSLIEKYLQSCDGKISDQSIILAYSNADVSSFNKRIREEFFPDSPKLTNGDKVMFIRNNYTHEFVISNGDFGLINRVFGETEIRNVTLKNKNKETNEVHEIKVPLEFRDVELEFIDFEGKARLFRSKILENLLYNKFPDLSSDENKALYVDFCMRNNGIKRGSLEFKETLKSDPYFNALRLKFGYAITTHKSQGSEWEHVFLKCTTHQNMLSADYFRWFYTGITRTKKNLYLLDPPDIKLGAGIKIVNKPSIRVNSLAENANNPYQDSQNIKHNVHEVVSENNSLNNFETQNDPTLSFILKKVRQILINTDLLIDDIIHNPWQESYIFSQNNVQTRIDISFNSKNKITNIRAPKVSEQSGKLINLLESVRGFITVEGDTSLTKNFKFQEPFKNEFHDKLRVKANGLGITIQDINEAQYSIRYFFVRDNQTAVFIVFNNSKGQFTKCDYEDSNCSSERGEGSLFKDAQTMITNNF